MKKVSKWKVGKSRVQYIDSDDSDNQKTENKSDNGKVNEGPPKCLPVTLAKAIERTDATMPPLSPISASENWKTCHTFLMSLSNNENYKKLLFLLHVAKSPSGSNIFFCHFGFLMFYI